jgi:hypothetical protein
MKLSDLPAHHAVLVIHGERGAVGAALWKEMEEQSLAHRFFDQTVLDIETVRQLISWAQTPYNGEKIALVSFHTAGIPAQNAMLKILEEPRNGVRFMLLTSNKEQLLPTVLSRVHEVQSVTNDKQIPHSEALLFLETKPTLRMKLPYVVELLSREDEEGRKDRESTRHFILGLVNVLSTSKQVQPLHIQETLEMASYAGDPSSSGKALLEYLALLLPSIK